MIKASAMFSAHVIHVLLRNTLISLVVICMALFLWLKSGIEADSLMVGKYKVEKLYLKLGKKLTLKADKVFIPKSKAKPSFDNLDKTFDKMKYLFTFFDMIDLKNVTFEDNTIDFLFTDEILYISSDDYEIAGNIHRVGQTLTVNVSTLHLKKNDINIKGKLTYDLTDHSLHTEGSFDAYHIEGSFSAEKQDDDIAFKLHSQPFSDLKTLINTLTLKDKAKAWIVDKVQAQKYTIQSLEGKGSIGEEGFKLDFDTLKAKAFLEDVKIYYKPELDPVDVESAYLHYAHRKLDFDLKKPKYKTRSMEGSKISIVGLGENQSMLNLDLHMKTVLDNEIQKILKSYKVDIPVKHKGEVVGLDLKMDIPLKKSKDTKKPTQKPTIFVNVDLKKSDVWYKNIKLPLKKGLVKFDNTQKNNIRVEATLKKGMLVIGKTKLPVLGGKVHYSKNKVILDDVHVKETWYEGKVSGSIDLKTKKCKLSLKAKHITLGDKKKFLVLKNKTLPFTLTYGKNVRIDIPSLDLKITQNSKELWIEVKKLEKLKPYLRNLGIDIDRGRLDIIKKSTNTYSLKGVLYRKACFFYEKSGVCHTKIPFIAEVKKGNVDFYAFKKRLHYSSKKSRLTVKNINIDLEKLLNERKKSKGTKGKKLVILGKKSKIRYDKHTLVTDSYDIEVSPSGNVKAFGSLDGDIVQFSKKAKHFSIKALRVKDKLLHPLIGFKGLKQGRYTLKKSGNPDKEMKGQIIIEGGIMSDFKAYNNTLAFINAIPAIATLSNPGFSEEGFHIIEGVAEYRMKKDKITFDSVYIKGTSSTIVGKGVIDLKKKTINMNLAIQTARELGKFVGNLPLLGYILMGKDKSMTVGLKITGSLSKPIVTTSAVAEILTLPLQLIKRTLESPAHIINK